MHIAYRTWIYIDLLRICSLVIGAVVLAAQIDDMIEYGILIDFCIKDDFVGSNGGLIADGNKAGGIRYFF